MKLLTKKLLVFILLILFVLFICVICKKYFLDKDILQDTKQTTTESVTQPQSIEILGKEYSYNTKSIDLHNCNISTADKIRLVQKYPDIEFKWTTNIGGVNVDSSDKSADISTHVITDLAELTNSLRTLPKLTNIDMCDCGLTNQQMEELQKTFTDVKFVWKVTLGLWTIRTDAVTFSTLKDGTITYRLTNEDVQVLKYCKDMVALDLGHNKVTDISFLEYMPELRILILVDNKDDSTGGYIQNLSELKYVPKLKYLEFFVGSVSDITFLQYLPELVDLNISYNPISDVTPLLKLPHIERLYFEHTEMTDEDYKLLQKTYPNAQVVYYGEGSIDQGWRETERYHAMIDMFHNNYVNNLFK